jgi:hypothetical protein
MAKIQRPRPQKEGVQGSGPRLPVAENRKNNCLLYTVGAVALIKKRKKISSYIRKFRVEQLQSQI